jgi:pimeloyl-ACP methyl ester carboxylesterase
MNIVDHGSGVPLVLIPGIQGRWEYHQPAIDALSRHFRVITFSLSGEHGSGCVFDSSRGLDNYTEQIVSALDSLRVDRAVVCGVSFGGVAAARFAAVHPDRCSALVLVSTPRPGLRLRRRHQIYVRLPWLFGPLFIAETPWRLRREIRTALPEARARRALRRWVVRTFFGAPPSISLMAARARLLAGTDIAPDCERIVAPTLVITGERGLDYVVPVDGSSAYTRLIGGARAVVLERTGHIGCATRPEVFADVIHAFVIDNVTSAAAGHLDPPLHTTDHVGADPTRDRVA